MKAGHKLLPLILTAVFTASGVSLTGTIMDPEGQPVPGTTVTLSCNTQGAAASDEFGVFRFDRLPAGSDPLRIEAAGFAPYVTGGIDLGDAVEKRDANSRSEPSRDSASSRFSVAAAPKAAVFGCARNPYVE